MCDNRDLVNQQNVIIFVVNSPDFFLSHRLPLALAALNAGFQVHVATSDGPEVRNIRSMGFTHHIVPFVRSGQNPLHELGTLIRMVRLFRRVKPVLVHLITIKPVLYGGIAARLAGVKSVVSAVSGLGTVFLADSVVARFRRGLVILLYRAAFTQKRLVVIFQNPDDCNVLLGLKALKQDAARMIRGSGVNLEDYPYLSQPLGKTVVVMASRLLRDKGVFEFVEAAKLLQDRGVAVEMRLIGSPDPGNPTSVTLKDLNKWKSKRYIEVLGYRTDIATQYAEAHIVCLPSYREGLPKSLVEAAACGRAVVTTDVPGCRDAIKPGVTGLTVPLKDTVALADAIQALVEDPEMRADMGRAGRALAEEAFAIEKIVDQHIDIYSDLIRP